MHPALERELARLGRAWGALNDAWLTRKRDYSHGSPAFKWHGANPSGAHSAKIRARRFGGNTAVTSPMRDRTKEKHPERAPVPAVALSRSTPKTAAGEPQPDEDDMSETTQDTPTLDAAARRATLQTTTHALRTIR